LGESLTLKVAAGTVFFDSEEILRLAVWNLVAQGVEDFFFIIHDNVTEAALAMVEEFDGRARIRLASKPTAPFLQGRMMSMLAEFARSEGFDVFIPFDSDEFFQPIDGANPLLKQITDWFTDESVPAMALAYTDHLQDTTVDEFTEAALATARYMPVKNQDAKAAIAEDDISRFFLHSKQKVIVNLNALPAWGNYFIVEGSHKLEVDGGFPILQKNEGIHIAHVPYRSKQNLFSRKIQAANRQAAGFGATSAQRLRIFDNLDHAAMELQWRRVSWEIGPNGVDFSEPNPRLKLAESDQINRCIARVEAEKASEPKLARETPEDRAAADAEFANRLFCMAVDAKIGFPHPDFADRHVLLQIIADLGYERDNLAALLKKHAPQLDLAKAAKPSLGQKVHKRLRAVARRLLKR
jgi:hypothetical protein